jgi:hypothetical protein
MNLAAYNKAIAAAIIAAIGLANVFFNAGIMVEPEIITAVLTALTPLVVYRIPNIKKD